MERTVSCPFLWLIYGNICETCINTSLVYQWSQLGINWYLHSSFNWTSTVYGLMKVGFNNFHWDTSVLGAQTAVHSCIWKCWGWKVAISNACHWKSPLLMCTWHYARTKLGLFLDLQELAPTVTITESLRRTRQHRKSQELLYLSVAVNLNLQTVLNFVLKFCRMLLRSCKCVCHEIKCFNVSVSVLPSMLPQRTAVTTRRVTVEVCIFVFVFDLCKSIRQLCTGVTCRYQVHVFIHKKMNSLSLSH